MTELVSKTAAFCEKHGMLQSASTVLACVSGGADSMCLMDIMGRLADRMGFELAVCHFNHRLRGAESDGDEAFVRSWCEKYGLRFFSGSADVLSAARERGTGVEETARQLRYEFFASVAAGLPGALIATAHTADDDLETVLLRLARGTGLRGLGGIPPVRGNIIRPLLFATREEIEKYLLDNSIPHREDSSNASDDYSRNLVRHKVVPTLRRLNPSVASSVSSMTELLRADEEFLSSLAHDFIAENARDDAVSCEALLSLPRPVASRVIRTLSDSGLSSRHVDDIFQLAASPSPSGSLSLPGTAVRREYDSLVFGGDDAKSFEPFTLLPGETVFVPELCYTFRAEIIENSSEIYKSFTTFLFKLDRLCGNITVRPRKTGDIIHLPSGGKSLKKLFIEKKVPRSRRESVPVICDGSGVIAVFGFGADIRTRPEPGDRVLKITIEENSYVDQ